MIQRFKRLWRDRRGNALAIAGAALPLLVGAAGLATDTIEWTLWKRELQRAADSAAIAGVYERSGGASETDTETAVDHDLTINHHTGIGLVSGYPQVTFPGDSGDMESQVRVVLAVRKSLPFSSMFMLEPPTIIARATAASVKGAGSPCIHALETNAASSGIMITGNAGIYMPDCTLHSNSPSTNSAYAMGSSEVYADSVSAVGGIQQSNNFQINSYDPYAPSLDDPFADIDPPTTFPSGNCPNVTVNPNQIATLEPGCFGSMTLKGTVTLNPGTYVLDGGSLNITSQANVICNGCTFILTNRSTASDAAIGTVTMNGGGILNITAPTDGTYKGIAIYQDRRATAGSKINGNSDSLITGALYFPSTEVDYLGTGNVTAVCTMFVVRRIKFTGNSSTSNKFKSLSECAAAGLPTDGGTRRVRLVA